MVIWAPETADDFDRIYDHNEEYLPEEEIRLLRE
jgi:hypothetical protein